MPIFLSILSLSFPLLSLYFLVSLLKGFLSDTQEEDEDFSYEFEPTIQTLEGTGKNVQIETLEETYTGRIVVNKKHNIVIHCDLEDKVSRWEIDKSRIMAIGYYIEPNDGDILVTI